MTSTKVSVILAKKTCAVMKEYEDSLLEKRQTKHLETPVQIRQFIFFLLFYPRRVFQMRTVDKQQQRKDYGVEDVIELVRQLSQSQGYYGRLLEQILYLQEYEPEAFEEFKMVIEEQHFKDPVDVVLFFEQ